MVPDNFGLNLIAFLATTHFDAPKKGTPAQGRGSDHLKLKGYK
jgi:hypothetical protein